MISWMIGVVGGGIAYIAITGGQVPGPAQMLSFALASAVGVVFVKTIRGDFRA